MVAQVIKYSEGASRKALHWQYVKEPWPDFIKRLSKVKKTSETEEEYHQMPKPKRDEIKDVGGFVGGKLAGGRRKRENVIFRSLITLDLDRVEAGVDISPRIELGLGAEAVIYSTHSHTKEAQRLRLIFPLKRTVSPEEYEAMARLMASDIGFDLFDPTTFEAHRLMYWPSAPKDSEYYFSHIEGEWLDPDEWLARYTDWRDMTEWPGVLVTDKNLPGSRQADSYDRPGFIGAFNRSYSIEAAIEKYLPEVYKPAGSGRWTYTKGSTSGGLIIYDGGKFAYSHHSTDPAEGRLVNAFDLVRIHLFSGSDKNAKEGTPSNRLPSFLKMRDLSLADENVKYDMILAQIDEDAGNELDWVKELDLTTKGEIASTISNTVKILINDVRLKDSYYYDLFRERPIVAGDMPWQKLENRQTAVWADSDDAGLRQFLEAEYNITNGSKIHDAVELAMLDKARHPVREYLKGLSWDGVQRAETLFIDTLAAEDSKYTRAVTKAALIGAVARIMAPGCKHDHMLVLVGPQGCGKSTILARLGGDYFSDSLYTMSGKDAFEQLQGAWILEMSEMAATKKAELEQIKQFISKQVDSYRAAYARRTQEHPRQCACFGSTNDIEFLKDPTGGRRFWPVVVGWPEKRVDIDADQIWAEIVEAYDRGEKWYLDEETEKLARKVQEEHTEKSEKRGLIEGFLNKEVPKDWDKWSLEDRLLFWAGGVFDVETEERQKVCVLELWVELFNGDAKTLSRTQSRELADIMRSMPEWEYKTSINCGDIWGRQRGFRRQKGSELAKI